MDRLSIETPARSAGLHALTADDLADRYHTYCDPRLNAEQAIELAFLVAENVRKERDARSAERQAAAS